MWFLTISAIGYITLNNLIFLKFYFLSVIWGYWLKNRTVPRPVVGVLPRSSRSSCFNSQAGHISKLQVWSPDHHLFFLSNQCFSVPLSLSPPPPLYSPSSLSRMNERHVLKWEFKKRIGQYVWLYIKRTDTVFGM